MWKLSLGDLRKQLVSSFLSDRTSELWASIKEIQRFFQARGLGGIAAGDAHLDSHGCKAGKLLQISLLFQGHDQDDGQREPGPDLIFR